MESLGFSIYRIMSSANNGSFTSSFPTSVSFISSCCLITLARASSTMLNKTDESGHPCLIPNLKGNTYRFCPLSVMLAVRVSYKVFIMLRYGHSISKLLRVFIVNRCWVLADVPSPFIDIIM